MKKVKIYFDGACRNVKDSVNEPYGIGVAVFIEGKFSTGFSLSKGFQNGGTSNIAEWEGCLYALRTAEEIFNNEDDFVNISIFSDSEIITKQFNGEYKVKEERFKQYYERCLAIAKKLKIVSITWIPREQNKEADKLSKEGLNSVKNDSK